MTKKPASKWKKTAGIRPVEPSERAHSDYWSQKYGAFFWLNEPEVKGRRDGMIRRADEVAYFRKAKAALERGDKKEAERLMGLARWAYETGQRNEIMGYVGRGSPRGTRRPNIDDSAALKFMRQLNTKSPLPPGKLAEAALDAGLGLRKHSERTSNRRRLMEKWKAAEK